MKKIALPVDQPIPAGRPQTMKLVRIAAAGGQAQPVRRRPDAFCTARAFSNAPWPFLPSSFDHRERTLRRPLAAQATATGPQKISHKGPSFAVSLAGTWRPSRIPGHAISRRLYRPEGCRISVSFFATWPRGL